MIFHPTDAIEDDWGKRILDRIAADGAIKTVRIYNMLEDIVSMDADGKLQYDYTLNDYRLDYLLEKGFTPLIAYAFIPPCIASDAGRIVVLIPLCCFSFKNTGRCVVGSCLQMSSKNTCINSRL